MKTAVATTLLVASFGFAVAGVRLRHHYNPSVQSHIESVTSMYKISGKLQQMPPPSTAQQMQAYLLKMLGKGTATQIGGIQQINVGNLSGSTIQVFNAALVESFWGPTVYTGGWDFSRTPGSLDLMINTPQGTQYAVVAVNGSASAGAVSSKVGLANAMNSANVSMQNFAGGQGNYTQFFATGAPSNYTFSIENDLTPGAAAQADIYVTSVQVGFFSVH